MVARGGNHRSPTSEEVGHGPGFPRLRFGLVKGDSRPPSANCCSSGTGMPMDLSKLGHTCVVGMHWGDEGKGKIVDLLSEHFDVVVRYNGGGNAGHTVQIKGEKFALHLLPVGV